MSEPAAFIRAHTTPLPVPSLPDLSLYQAAEVTSLWEMTEAELLQNGLAPPFWAFPWAGGQALGLWLRQNPHVVKGKRVLDLACGSGLVGIVAAKLGAAQVIANDIDPFAGAAVALNAALNGVNVTFDGADRLAEAPPAVDVILAGDICYEKSMTAAMLTFLRKSRALGIAVYVGDPHRSYFPGEGLARLATFDIHTDTQIEDRAVKPASVWSLI
ncbi:MAG: 50S ribosomal protein L11 methyltransferase [Asticcacaulis sp.]|uniref:class I SAM-dependent methyltransferase n=1 Tax=Asticcacaulis sp. TaxID=1872648 RepID=UPI0025C6DEC4|nr:50S ribosomal protein L11 methyltransferase [Asticcacaulis sp.]MCA1935924.1 50S ribosomal protein L11 methyltransferase [Asticcacaulis sp.]